MLSRSDLRRDRSGFSLTEVMVAILILMVGMLGMFQAINVGMERNVENQLRQKGVEVAEQQMSDIKARKFLDSSETSSFLCVPVAIGSVFKNMSVEWKAPKLASDSQIKQISVRVYWHYRGHVYEHQTASSVGITE